MTTPTSHPSLLDLAALHFRRLPPAAAAQLEAHLAACPAGSTTLKQVPAETLRALLDASATPAPDGRTLGAAAPTPAEPPATAVDGIPPELATHPNYKTLGILGSGGMGAVYQAVDA